MTTCIKTALSTLASLAVFAMALTVQAQTTTGTIYGTVTDPSGAAIPGCTVKVVDTATGVAQTAVTNGSGADTQTLVVVNGLFDNRNNRKGFRG